MYLFKEKFYRQPQSEARQQTTYLKCRRHFGIKPPNPEKLVSPFKMFNSGSFKKSNH